MGDDKLIELTAATLNGHEIATGSAVRIKHFRGNRSFIARVRKVLGHKDGTVVSVETLGAPPGGPTAYRVFNVADIEFPVTKEGGHD